MSVAKIILTEDVKGLGKAGDKVSVKGGYARNFLIPKRLAEPANPSAEHRAQAIGFARARSMAQAKQKAADLARRLEEKSWTVEAAVGASGKLHGAVTAADLSAALSAEGIALPKHRIVLDRPLNQLGPVELAVKLHPQVTAVLKVSIVKKQD